MSEWIPGWAEGYSITTVHPGCIEIGFFSKDDMAGLKYLPGPKPLPIDELHGELSRRDVVQQIRDKPLADRIKQPRYQDATGEDWIDQSYRDLSWSEFCGAMKFTIGKYMRRLGKKDDEVSELEKVADYAERWVKKARQRIDEKV